MFDRVFNTPLRCNDSENARPEKHLRGLCNRSFFSGVVELSEKFV